jgi:hypothetical protein
MPHPLSLALVCLSVLLTALAAAHEPSYAITLLNVPGISHIVGFLATPARP